ncbi:MAG TPA: DUF1254 domain-containing protein [Parvibaculum sp.]|jgi:uncharacterized membrane protein
MKRLVTFVVATFLLAAIVHVASVWAYPRVVMSVAMKKIGGNHPANTFAHMPLPTDKARGIVRPSPDLAYSMCIIDVSKGPIRIQVPLTAPYTSVSLYTTKTDNYFVRNDRDTGGKDLDLIVLARGASKPAGAPAGAEIVEAPTAKSLVLVRRAAESAAAYTAIDPIRAKSICAPFKG